EAVVVRLAGADRDRRERGCLEVVVLKREPQRTLAPPNGFVSTGIPRRDEAEVGVRRSQLATRRPSLEQRDPLPSGALGLGCAAGTLEELGQDAKYVTLLHRVAVDAMALRGGLDGGDAFVVLVGHIAGSRLPLEQVGSLGWAQALAEPKRPGLLGGGFAVRSDRRGTVAGFGREPKHGLTVARTLGVVREPREV